MDIGLQSTVKAILRKINLVDRSVAEQTNTLFCHIGKLTHDQVTEYRDMRYAAYSILIMVGKSQFT